MLIDRTMVTPFGTSPTPNARDRATDQRVSAPIIDAIRLVLDVPYAAVVFPTSTPTQLGPNAQRIAAVVDSAIGEGRPVAVCDTLGPHSVDGTPAETPVRAVIAAPFVSPQHGCGAVVAFDIVPRDFAERDLAILAQFARCILSELHLSERADTDDLTGLTRRQPFTAALGLLLHEFAEHETPAVLSIVDLDHFKRINDGFGHAAGDLVLRLAAQAMRRVLGPDAILCRLGGEEFAIALPQYTLNMALPVLERTRRAIGTLAVPEHEGIAVSASFGVAPLNAALGTVSAWFKTADAALYTAKQSGRNQIRVGWQTRPDAETGATHAADQNGQRWSGLSIAI
ncbi:hypothetical protein DLJ53_14630 [Acuticoccus sediminis]|uniref:diguanylate cyclase n=2 Tax=Acuticoccus sediminis TaxID=2184697 RepID=A0A8B2NQ93_9HYPH|nr:hypothetical protein DLJ53_14630 [Acuticoccus sediminis]